MQDTSLSLFLLINLSNLSECKILKRERGFLKRNPFCKCTYMYILVLKKKVLPVILCAPSMTALQQKRLAMYH